MNIKFSPPDITDLEITAVTEAMKSGWITTGPKTKEFERKIADYCGAQRAVALNSATAGLELTLRILGITEGDEVITSSYTYTASASIIEHVGAKIVLCDTQKDSFEIDYDALERNITDKTKVIIPVDIGGVPCDYDRLYNIVENKRALFKPANNLQAAYGRVVILADAAHSFGATRDGIHTGNLADFSSFSFHAVKNLTTAEGGAVTWRENPSIDSEQLYKQYMLWSLHGQSKDALAKTQIGAWEYDIQLLGQKCNMTDIAAAIGLTQLQRYSEILARRKQIIERYDNAFKGTSINTICHYSDDFASSGHLYLTRISGISESKRNDIIIKMAERGIATNVHYKPLPMHTAYKKLGFSIDDYPNAYCMYCNEITLPLHTLLTDEEIDYIIDNYLEIGGSL